MTWTVVVEVHLNDGKGAIFTVGKFPFSKDASSFAVTLDWEIGEEKITTSVMRNDHVFEWLARHGKKLVSWKSYKPYPVNILQPPCEIDLEEQT